VNVRWPIHIVLGGVFVLVGALELVALALGAFGDAGFYLFGGIVSWPWIAVGSLRVPPSWIQLFALIVSILLICGGTDLLRGRITQGRVLCVVAWGICLIGYISPTTYFDVDVRYTFRMGIRLGEVRLTVDSISSVMIALLFRIPSSRMGEKESNN
jgi:hypothetical protein